MICCAVSLKTIASNDRFEELVRTLQCGCMEWEEFTQARFDQAFLGLETPGKGS